MKNTNNYICGINPKALEKYAKKFFKQQGPRAYVKNDGGKIYFAFDFFAAFIPAAAYKFILQPIVMQDCPKDGEMLVRYSGKDFSWEPCDTDAFDICSLFNYSQEKCKEMVPTAITYSNSVGNYRIFKSDAFISAANENFIEIFDVFSTQLFQQNPTGPINIYGGSDEFKAIIMPLKIEQDLLGFAQFADATNSKNDEEKKRLEEKVNTLNTCLTAAEAEILRLKEELEKAQAATKAAQEAQEAQQAAEKHEEKQKREVMASPKERRITHKKENRPNKEQAAEKTDSQKEQAPKVMEVPDGKQSASMVEVIKSLESLFEKLNKKYFGGELVKPVITVQQDSTRGAYGWCTGWKAWRDNDGGGYYEINICAETLNRPLEQTAETFLHEMVHLYNIMQKVKDTSRGGTYHNTKFRDAAQDHGLVVEKGEKYGWHKTTLTEEALDWLHGTDFLGFTLCRPAVKKKPTVSKSSSRKYVCPCCGSIVRATKEVRIICADCDEEMLLEE